MAKPPKPPEGYEVIYCRYRRTTGGTVLDAHAYGYKAWRLTIPKGRRRKKR